MKLNDAFDTYSQQDIAAINNARKRVSQGDCLTFATVEEMSAYFE